MISKELCISNTRNRWLTVGHMHNFKRARHLKKKHWLATLTLSKSHTKTTYWSIHKWAINRTFSRKRTQPWACAPKEIWISKTRFSSPALLEQLVNQPTPALPEDCFRTQTCTSSSSRTNRVQIVHTSNHWTKTKLPSVLETDSPSNSSSQVLESAWLREQTIFRVAFLVRLELAYQCVQVLLEPRASNKTEAVPLVTAKASKIVWLVLDHTTKAMHNKSQAKASSNSIFHRLQIRAIWETIWVVDSPTLASKAKRQFLSKNEWTKGLVTNEVN